MTAGGRGGFRGINCYELLGIGPDSSAQEIKSAYRRISLTTHPDVGGSDEAQSRVNYAYEVLSDPVRRKLHDDVFILSIRRAGIAKAREKKDWKPAPAKAARKGVLQRVREEVEKRTAELRSGTESSAMEIFSVYRRDFNKTRALFILSLIGLAASFAAGFFLHPLWALAVIPGRAAYLRRFFIAESDRHFVLDPESVHVLKRKARRRAKIEIEKIIDGLCGRILFAERMVVMARSPFSRGRGEDLVARGLAVSFFLLGYLPSAFDRRRRILVFSDGESGTAVRYRHRSGGPANTGYVKKLKEFMAENGITKGFMFSTPGLSGTAARYAEANGIAHYSLKDMDSWMERTLSGNYPGPPGDILKNIDMLDSFLNGMHTTGK